jgi:hypothetical protein
MRYQRRGETSKLWAMVLPNSSVPIWPSPSLSTQLSAPAVGTAPAPRPTEYSRKVDASTAIAQPHGRHSRHSVNSQASKQRDRAGRR